MAMASPGHPTVQWVKKTGEKVDLVAFHPILPWVAYARRDNVVAIWDYLADQVSDGRGAIFCLVACA